jgi:hypothetical protein
MEPIPTTAKQACILCYSSSMLLYISYLSYLIHTEVLYVNIDSFAPQAKIMGPIENTRRGYGSQLMKALRGASVRGVGRGLYNTASKPAYGCQDDVSPADMSRNKSSWMLRPLVFHTLPDTWTASKIPDLRHLSHNLQKPS